MNDSHCVSKHGATRKLRDPSIPTINLSSAFITKQWQWRIAKVPTLMCSLTSFQGFMISLPIERHITSVITNFRATQGHTWGSFLYTCLSEPKEGVDNYLTLTYYYELNIYCALYWLQKNDTIHIQTIHAATGRTNGVWRLNLWQEGSVLAIATSTERSNIVLPGH